MVNNRSKRKSPPTTSESNVRRKKKTKTASSTKTAAAAVVTVKDDPTSIFHIDCIMSRIYSYCNYGTKATTLHSVSKDMKNLINQELYIDAMGRIPDLLKEEEERSNSNNDFQVLSFRKGWSNEYTSRDEFVDDMWDNHDGIWH